MGKDHIHRLSELKTGLHDVALGEEADAITTAASTTIAVRSFDERRREKRSRVQRIGVLAAIAALVVALTVLVIIVTTSSSSSSSPAAPSKSTHKQGATTSAAPYDVVHAARTTTLEAASTASGYAGPFPREGPATLMKASKHGTCVAPVQPNLRFKVDVANADKICCYNRSGGLFYIWLCPSLLASLLLSNTHFLFLPSFLTSPARRRVPWLLADDRPDGVYDVAEGDGQADEREADAIL
jgi:hypothetical protein